MTGDRRLDKGTMAQIKDCQTQYNEDVCISTLRSDSVTEDVAGSSGTPCVPLIHHDDTPNTLSEFPGDKSQQHW